MGAWGPGAFQNDTACDLLVDILEGGDLPLLEETLDGLLGSRARGDAFDAETGVAAAELVARLKGRPSLRASAPHEAFVEPVAGPDLRAVDAWVEQRKAALTDRLFEKAQSSMTRMLRDAADHKERWRNPQGFTAWQLELEDLLERLR